MPLRDNAAVYKALFELANDAIFLMENDRFVECNAKTLEIFGCNKDQILEKLPVDFSPAFQPDGRASIDKAREKIEAAYQGQPQRFEWLHCRLDGTTFPAEVSLVVINLENKPYLHAIVRDITERKQYELELQQHREHLEEMVLERTEQLAESERQHREAEAVAHVGHWRRERDPDQIIWSDETYRIFGLIPGEEEITLDLLRSFIHPDDRDNFIQKGQETLYNPNGDSFSLDHRIVRRSGEVLWVHEEGYGEFDQDGQWLRVVGTMQDISARKHAEEALVEARLAAEKANRAKGEFLSRMSHELRTPMNAILGFSQLLKIENLTPEQSDLVKEIHAAGDHLLELIDDTLDLARIEVGKLAIDIQPVELSAVVNQAIQIVQPHISKNEISVINQCQDESMVWADQTRLRQILVNLLSNAAKYNRRGGRVTVRSKMIGTGHISISVEDTGAGIPEELMEDLFTPFERLGAEKTKVEGLGIGLSYSKQLAEMMKMELDVVSVQGQGSTFSLKLSLAKEEDITPATVEQVTVEQPVVEQPNVIVLYIEDNPSNLRLVEAFFQTRKNMHLLSASDGEFGLELSRRKTPDIILLDLNLPGKDGLMINEELKANPLTRNIPVIAISANAMPERIEQVLQAGFAAYIVKPVVKDSLFQMIEKQLQQTR